MSEYGNRHRTGQKSKIGKPIPTLGILHQALILLVFLVRSISCYQGYYDEESVPQKNDNNIQQYLTPTPPPLSPQYTPQTYYKNVQTYQYSALSYQELNISSHCGVIPDTQYELYRKAYNNPYEVADVVPYGKFPWIALILYYNKVVCQGTLVHYNLILTSSKCVPQYGNLDQYKIRIGDWDVLTDYNEYEAYADRELRICSRHPVSSYNTGGYLGSYRSSSNLILLQFESDISYDKFPQVKPICLPKTYSSSYYYSGGMGRGDYSYKPVCWVAGWYGSKIMPLQNHPKPEKVEGYGYGYSNLGNSHYHQKYYKGYDESMIQMRAKVKQVPCPSSYSYGYDYKKSSYSSICFAGVEGYDACVAERGAAVFCIVKERQGYGQYDSGYNNYNKDYKNYPEYNDGHTVSSSLHPDYNHDAPPPSSQYYEKGIKCKPSPPKPYRYRAILYAVIEKPTKCRKGYYDAYGNSYSKKSRPVVATRVNKNVVSGILDTFWVHGYDHSCRISKRYGNQYRSSRYNYYFGSYYSPPKSSYYSHHK